MPDQDSLDGVGLLDVVWTGARFVAIGDDVVLDSSDGRTWHRQAANDEDVVLAQLAAGPRGIVVIGSTEGRRASWVSDDGLTWGSRVDAFGGAAISDVVATDEGWLAVGAEIAACNTPDCGSPVRAIVWTSVDGLGWTPVATQPSLRGAEMDAVTRGGPGYVAVGHAGDAAGGAAAAVWTSSDGQVWTRVPDGPQFHHPFDADPPSSAYMNEVVAAGGEIVAIGVIGSKFDGDAAPAVWWSPDGTDWSLVADRPHEDEIFNEFGPIVTVPGGFLAIGFQGEGGCPGVIWASADGTLYDMLTAHEERLWSCSSPDPAPRLAGAAAASPELLVLVGGTAIWVHPIP